MNSVLSIIFVFAICGLTMAWSSNKLDNEVYGGWLPSRRSLHCVTSGGQCMKTYQCCNEWDVCYISTKNGRKYGLLNPYGECRNLMKGLDGYGAKFGREYKKEDQPCKDSSECADQCCRIIGRGRLGTEQTCGKPGLYACVGGAKPSPNSIYGF